MPKFLYALTGQFADGKIGALLSEMSRVCEQALSTFKSNRCHDDVHLVPYEREGDGLKDRMYQLLARKPLWYFERHDVSSLTIELDNVLNGMRRASWHITLFARYFPNRELPDDARELVAITSTMLSTLRSLVSMLRAKRYDRGRMRTFVADLSVLERKADDIRHSAERSLMDKYAPESRYFEYIAWQTLYAELEDITDRIAHCGKHVLTLARA